jgi:hypothetical protein
VTVPAGHFYLAPGYMVSADNKIVAIEVRPPFISLHVHMK